MCTVLLRHGGTLKGRRATSSLGNMVEVEERWEDPAPHPQCVLPINCGETELKSSVGSMVFKATTNDRRTSSTLP
ncbi:hypothetical protein TNCV_880121 [Trichonephila clavipes]|nr:hypothetical protein TNCV_880121 [Trichonephila clavipes]